MVLVGCRPNPAVATPTQTVSGGTPNLATAVIPTEATASPSPTKIPLAARVNEIEISLLEYQVELEMYRAAKGADLAPEDERVVLDDLINRALLASAAAEDGFTVTDALINERIQQITASMQDSQSINEWMKPYQFDEQTFNRALRLSIAAAWMRDQIILGVPAVGEQVHARQIILYDASIANDVYQQLQSGYSFRNLALEYDPLTGGDLGWFPRGYLPHSAVEEAVFSLEAEEYSPIIETLAGFHIVQMLEKDPERELSPDALLALQSRALQDWLILARENSQIEILVPSP